MLLSLLPRVLDWESGGLAYKRAKWVVKHRAWGYFDKMVLTNIGYTERRQELSQHLY